MSQNNGHPKTHTDARGNWINVLSELALDLQQQLFIKSAPKSCKSVTLFTSLIVILYSLTKHVIKKTHL